MEGGGRAGRTASAPREIPLLTIRLSADNQIAATLRHYPFPIIPQFEAAVAVL